MSHSEQFWLFFLSFGLGLLIIVSYLVLGVRLKFPDMSHDSGRWIESLTSSRLSKPYNAAKYIHVFCSLQGLLTHCAFYWGLCYSKGL